MRKLIIDFSPIMYSALISVSNTLTKKGHPTEIIDNEEKLVFDYKDQVLFKILEEIAGVKNQFKADEVIIACDNSQGGYWRKDVYERYKYGRKDDRKKSNIPWGSAFEVFNELIEQLKQNTSFTVTYIPKIEADDHGFILSKYFSNLGYETVIHTLDGDWGHCLNYPNVKWFKTRKTQRLPGIFVEMTKEELKTKDEKHRLEGDKGDGFLHIKSWTQFSPQFLEKHPNYKGKESKVYGQHHQIEKMCFNRYNFEAYKHPRFGMKSWKKKNQELQNLFKENPIYKMNYERNCILALPENIPQDITDKVINDYETTNRNKNLKEFRKYLMKNGLFEITTYLSHF